MFDRLNTLIEVNRWEPISTQSQFGIKVNGEFKGIHYQYAHSPEFVKIIDLIPLENQRHFCLSAMIINTVIPPHTDSDIKAAINVYIQTDNCITQFYDMGPVTNTYQIDSQTNGLIFDENDLIKSAGFIAKPNEVWILDVTKPHSVQPLSSFTERVAITLATNEYTYDEVCDLLKTKGLL